MSDFQKKIGIILDDIRITKHTYYGGFKKIQSSHQLINSKFKLCHQKNIYIPTNYLIKEKIYIQLN